MKKINVGRVRRVQSGSSNNEKDNGGKGPEDFAYINPSTGFQVHNRTVTAEELLPLFDVVNCPICRTLRSVKRKPNHNKHWFD